MSPNAKANLTSNHSTLNKHTLKSRMTNTQSRLNTNNKSNNKIEEKNRIKSPPTLLQTINSPRSSNRSTHNPRIDTPTRIVSSNHPSSRIKSPNNKSDFISNNFRLDPLDLDNVIYKKSRNINAQRENENSSKENNQSSSGVSTKLTHHRTTNNDNTQKEALVHTIFGKSLQVITSSIRTIAHSFTNVSYYSIQ